MAKGAAAPARGQDGAEKPPYHVAFRVSITVTPSEGWEEALKTPRFRFCLFGEHQVVTEPVDDAAAWKAVEELHPGGEAPEGESFPAGEAEAVAACASGRTWRRTFDGVDVGREFALKLNDQPDDGAGGRRNYLGWVRVDMSALLGGARFVCARQGNPGAREAGDLLPSSPGPCPRGVDAVQVAVAVDRPLLRPSLYRELNPLTLTLAKVDPMPGIRVDEEDPGQQRFVREGRYALLDKHCLPAYCTLRCFDGAGCARRACTETRRHGAAKAVWNRSVVYLVGAMDRQEAMARLGSFPLEVEVHDRDPDLGPAGPAPGEGEEASAVERAPLPELEALVEEGDNKGKGGKSDASSEEGGEGTDLITVSLHRLHRAHAAQALRLAGRPAPVWEVDERVRAAEEAAWGAAGDDHAHGAAVLRLHGLLSRAHEVAELLRQRREKEEAARQRAARAQRAQRAVKARAVTRRAREREALADALQGEGGAEEGDGGAHEGGGEGVDTDEWGAGADPVPAVSERIKASVLPRKRRVVPKGGDIGDMDRGDEELFAKQPGRYVEAGTRLTVTASLAAPLVPETPPTEAPPAAAFTRAVFVLPYHDAATVRRLMAFVRDSNVAVLPAGVSVNSHKLSADERARAESGDLDLVTGFHAVDDVCRIVVLEGLAAGAMGRLEAAVPRDHANRPDSVRLQNDGVRFPARLYTAFDAVPKMLHLRYRLEQALRRPEMYNRSIVEEECFQALHRLLELRACTRLRLARDLQLFPAAASLQRVERVYGETVTVADIEGGAAPSRRGQARAAGDEGAGEVESSASAVAGTVAGQVSGPKISVSAPERAAVPDGASSPHAAPPSAEQVAAAVADTERRVEEATGKRRKSSHKRKADTEARNPAFEAYLAQREPRDWLSARAQEREEAEAEADRRRARREAEAAADPDPVYPYSGQRLRDTAKQEEEMRRMIRRDKRATYTRAPDFLSQTVAGVNPDEVAAAGEKAARAKWVTQRGFVYPAPKRPDELRRLPNALHPARADELRSAWDEELARGDVLGRVLKPVRGKEEFRPLVKPAPAFGGTNGDGTPNPDYFTSVHLVGDGLEAEMEEARKKAEEEWSKKVVVDSLRFQPHFSLKRLNQVDRTKDVLEGKPQKRGVRAVHRAKLPSGKWTQLKPPPVAALSMEEYSKPVDFTSMLGSADTSKFAGRTEKGDPVNFQTSIHRNALRKDVHRHLHRRKHAEVPAQERTGHAWGRSTQRSGSASPRPSPPQAQAAQHG